MKTNTMSIGCLITPSNPTSALGITITIDNQVVYTNLHVKNPINFTTSISDDDATHVLKFILSGKTAAMTKIDDQGNIIEDATLDITNLTLDNIEIDDLVSAHCVYEHDLNGNGPVTKEKFFSTMGCNGTASLEFSTPIYLWLLENM